MGIIMDNQPTPPARRPFIAYLIGGPADLTKMAIPNPAKRIYVAHMDPVATLKQYDGTEEMPDVVPTVKKLGYEMIGGFSNGQVDIGCFNFIGEIDDSAIQVPCRIVV